MSHEQIIGSWIYYYSSSEHMEDAGLSFRRKRVHGDYPEYVHTTDTPPPEGAKGWQENVELGSVPTTQGTSIAFSNHLQHRVTQLYNPSKDQVAVRKIFCFFLVNPKVKIVSSLHVPMQQWEFVKMETAKLLCLISKRLGHPFPKDVVMTILDFAKVGFTREEAHAIREEIIKERKFETNLLNQIWEREYSLCEH
jgi:hypothetical protein